MPDVNDLKNWIGLIEASPAFQLAVPLLLAALFAALADAMQDHLTPQRQKASQEEWTGIGQPTL